MKLTGWKWKRIEQALPGEVLSVRWSGRRIFTPWRAVCDLAGIVGATILADGGLPHGGLAYVRADAPRGSRVSNVGRALLKEMVQGLRVPGARLWGQPKSRPFKAWWVCTRQEDAPFAANLLHDAVLEHLEWDPVTTTAGITTAHPWLLGRRQDGRLEFNVSPSVLSPARQLELLRTVGGVLLDRRRSWVEQSDGVLAVPRSRQDEVGRKLLSLFSSYGLDPQNCRTGYGLPT
jgi:hypothetical protein